ncbi:MAG: hypothetical protein J6M64_13295 [Oscillospiraceae bacterium]|nr:hypothetical protein [Oscillospiraceae bacterium]
MRKLFSILIIFLLLFFSVSAIAEEPVRTGLSWEEFGPAVDVLFAGKSSFVSIDEVDAKLWLPDYLKESTLTTEDLENDAIACFLSDDGSTMLYITYMDMEGATLESFNQTLVDRGLSPYFDTINDIPALFYYIEENDVLVVTYQTADGYFLQLMFFPFSDETFSLHTTFILSSIQPDIEEKETVPSEHPVSSLISK